MQLPEVDQALTSTGMRLVAAKLAPRLGSARYLARPRLVETLDGAVGAKLVVVRAPAGFGKTTFLVEYHRWLQERGVTTAWLTLDEADNEISRFLAHVLAAFQAIDPTLALITSPDGERDLRGAALDLIHHLSMQTAPFALFLDNLESVQAGTVVGMLRTIVDALPIGGRLIVASREAPQLGLGRLRAHGHLVEITQDALRFSLEESAALLHGECRFALDDQQIKQLHRRTQGWAAGLWLATLALQGHGDPGVFVRSFSGSNAAVADYLLDDVLSRLPEDSRAFLLAVSVLDELSPPLCDAITEHHDSQSRLAAFEQAGLFVVQTGPEGGSYRFHPLFRDFLRNQLARTDPLALARLNRLAAHWYLQRGQPVSALEHLIRAGDEGAALEILGAQAEPLLWQGRVLLLARLFDRLAGATGPDADPRLKCVHGWALLFTHRYVEALAQVDQVEAQGSCTDAIRAELAVQRAFILAMNDRVEEALAAWEACKGKVSSAQQPFAHSIQQNSHAYCLIAANRFEEARDLIDQGRPSHQQIGSAFNLAVGACLEGSIDLARGDVRSAVSRCRDALAATTMHPGQHVSGSTIAAAFLAEACYAAGQSDEAERLLDAYLPMLDEVAAPDQLITSRVIMARIADRRGDRTRADRHLAALERKGRLENLPRLVGSANLERARMALRDGDLQEARALLEHESVSSLPDPGGDLSLHATDVEGPLQAWAALTLQEGRETEVIAPLEQAIARALSQGRLRRAHQLRELLAMALDRCARIADAPRPAKPGPEHPATDQTEAVRIGQEWLTPREVRALQLLAEGHANRVIAQRMCVSESTVKSYLRSINAKLGAENRTHAVAIARRLEILAQR